MVRPTTLHCSHCGAPLPLQPGLAAVTCTYCGTRALVQPTQHAPLRPPPVAPPPTSPGRPSAAVGVIVATSAFMAFALMGTVAFTLTKRTRSSASISPPLSGAPLSGAPIGPSFQFNDRPMLADVNGDGTMDVVGKSSLPGRTAWIAAYDGRDGHELWRTAALSKEATEGYASRAVLLGRVVSIDALGQAQAYDLRSGAPLWSARLGEKAARVCQGKGVIVVQTVDEARHGLDPATGQAREVSRGEPCAPVSSSNRDEAPGYQIIGWWQFEAFGLPSLHATEGLSAHRALVPIGPGSRFLLGSRAKGSQVAMTAAIDKRKVLWKELVPGVDPLTTTVNVTTVEAAYAGGLLVIPYDMNDHSAGTRMAAFDGSTGKRLWDVEVHRKTQVSSGLSITESDVFFASWSTVYVIALKTGQLRYKIGAEF